MKFTNQRVAILDFLKNNLNHPTVEEIYEEVKKTLPQITKATVYKNLKILTDRGFIKEVNVRGVSRFEAKIEPHHHIVCKNCGKIVDFMSPELIDYSLKLIKNYEDFNIDSAETTFFGICKTCNEL
jgi:Fur family ferric uptake transcriptional regulator